MLVTLAVLAAIVTSTPTDVVPMPRGGARGFWVPAPVFEDLERADAALPHAERELAAREVEVRELRAAQVATASTASTAIALARHQQGTIAALSGLVVEERKAGDVARADALDAHAGLSTWRTIALVLAAGLIGAFAATR